MAINMGRVQTDIKPAGNWTIDAVEDLARNQPQKCGTDMAVYDGLERDEPG